MAIHRTCPDCGGTKSTVKTLRCRACSFKCRLPQDYYQYKGGKPKCIECGTLTTQYTSKRCKGCVGKGMLGSNNPAWVGGETLRDDGRFVVNKGDVFRYRAVAEEVLGRVLKEREVIHHINENPSDDRKENLYLFRTKSAHMKWHGYLRRNKLAGLLDSNLSLYSLKTV